MRLVLEVVSRTGAAGPKKGRGHWFQDAILADVFNVAEPEFAAATDEPIENALSWCPR